jgi:putative RecB family exonuclease
MGAPKACLSAACFMVGGMTAESLAEHTASQAPTAMGSLSPSRAADFMACPLLYRFRVVDRLPEPPSRDAARGTIVHAVLERLFDLAPAERTADGAAAMVVAEWERLVNLEPDLAQLFADDADGSALGEWLQSARRLLGQYFELEDPRVLQPRQREMYVETELDSGLRLRGYIDRLDVSVDGDLRVVDYKTGRAPGQFVEYKALFQMRFYALVLWRLFGRVPRMLQLLYLGSGEILRYEPDEAGLRATERKLAALWRAIQRAAESGDWRASPSRMCDWCHHRQLCPAWGGTPPPLPIVDPPVASDVEQERVSPHSPIDEV